MKILRYSCVLLFASTLMLAQAAQTAADLAKQRPAAKPSDVDTLDHILAATYDVISGPPGPRNWDRFRSLFLPGAKLTAAEKSRKNKTDVVDSMTVDDYIKGAGDYFLKEGFFENPLETKTVRFGNVAHSFSSYESHHAPGDKPFERGINSFQFAWDGQRWWVVSILWDNERPDNPIPEDMLKH